MERRGPRGDLILERGKEEEEMSFRQREHKKVKLSSDELACLMVCEIVVSLSSCYVWVISANLHRYVLTSSQPLPLE